MKQNKYEDSVFFYKYSNMERSKNGLEAAGEWHELRKLLPDFQGKRVLDSGCGYGWHCRFAIENRAKSVIGIDISQKMLSEAMYKTKSENIQYICMPIEDIDFPANSFDVIISALAFHYIQSFEEVIKYRKTMTTYLNSLIKADFEITGFVEPEPAENLLYTVPGMLDELHRPMMLLVSSRKR